MRVTDRRAALRTYAIGIVLVLTTLAIAAKLGPLPTIWQREPLTIVVAGLVLAVETALVLALVQLARRRREAQRLLEARLRFGHLLSELSLWVTTAAPDEIDAAVEASLSRIARGAHIDWVLRWDFGDQRDAGWDSPALRAGEPAFFETRSALPHTIQDKLNHAGARDGPSVAVPLSLGGAVAGAVFWSNPYPGAASVGIDELQMVGTAIGTVLQRKQAERALRDSDRLKGAILASLQAHVAVLDREGTIIAVNDAWLEFGRANGAAVQSAIGPGANYLRACMAGIRAGDPSAVEALHLVEAACAGEHDATQIEYRCDSSDSPRWFLMMAEPLRRPEGGAVISHSDITTRKLNEIALRESEGRFRRMTDALPVAVWMAEASAQCTYFNQQWLRMTGRTLEEEVGAGWSDGLHPEDRATCLKAYLDAFQGRERFHMEYRLRQHDGEYRWLLVTGMPRYGSDGAFHGYIGGCIDITERREAEQMHRDLNRRLLVAQEEERNRIARELHDHLNQQLALLAIDLQQLSMSPPESPDALAAALHADWRRTTEIASDVHAISHRLHPTKLEALGLVATIRAHCRDVSRQGFAVHFSDRDVPTGIPPDISLCLFRVFEEALSNAARHSGTSTADVALDGSSGEIVLRVADGGRGLTSGQRSSGLGLVSMRERLQLVGGSLSITSAPGLGTVVEARAPRLTVVHDSAEPVESVAAVGDGDDDGSSIARAS